MNLSHRFVLLGLAMLVTVGGCRRRSKLEVSAPPADAVAASADQVTGSPDVSVPTRTYLAPPATAAPQTDEAHRFIPPEPMNMYSPARPGDYQAQLNDYNRILRKWSEGADVPQTFHDLMATYNSPKPPQPPAGRTLAYDRRTVSVSLR